jgi:hypothetical protein
MKKTLSPPPPIPDVSKLRGIVKTSPRGRRYKLYTVPLSALPAFLEAKKLEPKKSFHFPPEARGETEEERARDWVLGVKRILRKGRSSFPAVSSISLIMSRLQKEKVK